MGRIIHITHTDADGVGCAVLFKLYIKYVLNSKYELEEDHDITIHTSNHGIDNIVASVFEDYSDISELVISDISPAKDTPSYNMLMDIYNGKKDVKVTLIDHHLTNPFKDMESREDFSINVYTSASSLLASKGKGFIDDLESQLHPYKIDYSDILDVLNNYHGDDISATFIMYLYYSSLFGELDNIHPNLPEVITDFVYAISRYDTWEWCKQPIAYNEDIVTNAIKYNPVETVTDTIYYAFSGLIYNITSGKIPEALQTGDLSYIQFLPDEYKAIEHVAASSMEKYMKLIDVKLKVSSSGEYLYGMIVGDNSVNMSVVSEKIEKLYPNVFDYIVILYPETRMISFRTARDTVDVSRIARRCYGGGGHRAAAGAMLEVPTFMSFLNEYLVSHSINYFIHEPTWCGGCGDNLSKLTANLVYGKLKMDLLEESDEDE